MIEASRSAHGGAIREALRTITGDSDAADSARLDSELRAAQRIQRALVGLTETRLGGWELACEYEPAREIGGDFFDAFPILDPGQPQGSPTQADADGAAAAPARALGFVIADVSGKGISAALLMAFVRPVVRAALDRTGTPAAALERTNRILASERQTGLFVTVLAGTVELSSGVVVLANAGHEPAIVVRANGAVNQVEGGGPLLGAFGTLGLTEIRLELERGDRLLTYTDGVTDATNPAGARFGEARLLEAVRDAGPSVDELVASITAAVGEFRGRAEPADDLALLALGRAG